jgi:hypothetical protein
MGRLVLKRTPSCEKNQSHEIESHHKEKSMIVRKILLAAGAAALMSTPAWGLPSQAPSNHGTSHAPTGQPGKSGDPHGKGNQGKSHKCTPHKVAYVASGVLSSQTLAKNADGTYSGGVTVEVKRTNHHAAADKGKTVTYNVSSVHITFGLKDTNSDGSVGLDDLKTGDRVQLNGKITTLAKKCSQTGFAAETTIRKIVFHAPASAKGGKG